MNNDIHENIFEPNLNAEFSKRFEIFKKDMEISVSKRYGYYFDPKIKMIDYGEFVHWIWYYLLPDISHNGGNPVAVLF